MKYEKIIEAEFLERPNRFIAHALLDGKAVVAHVKNTGRCKELLVPGAKVYLNEPAGKERKTKYDLVAVVKKREGKESILINMDSQAPNDAVADWLPSSGLFSPDAIINREVRLGESRFDFAITEPNSGKITYLEVKGVTLEKDGVVMFPDAPTERGVKHIKELSSLALAGVGAVVLFVVQMNGATLFKPNRNTHPEFAEALSYAASCGVKILAYDSLVSEDSMAIDKPINICLS